MAIFPPEYLIDPTTWQTYSQTVRSMAVTTVRKVASVIAAMHRPKFPL
jgi:hypothetical protein